MRWIPGCCGLTFVVGIIASAAVRMTEKPSWLMVTLAVIAATATPTFVAWKIFVVVRRKPERIEAAAGTESPRQGVES